MKILYLLLTTELDEPEAVDQFIAGYEDNGATWDGTMTVVENMTNEEITTEFLQTYIDAGYEVVLRNTAGSLAYLDIYESSKNDGLLFIIPVGSNTFLDISGGDVENIPYFGNQYVVVTCGAGLNGTNQTSYPCLFFDADPSDILGGVPYQSYSTPYIAGKMCYIKEQRGGDWDDTIGACIVTASEGGVFDHINGYGIIDVSAAIGGLDTALETPVLTGSESSAGNFNIEWNLIPFAETYEIYFRGELLDTVTAHITAYSDALTRQNNSRKNFYKVRAVRGDEYSEWSNLVEYPYYYYTGILVKEYA